MLNIQVWRQHAASFYFAFLCCTWTYATEWSPTATLSILKNGTDKGRENETALVCGYTISSRSNWRVFLERTDTTYNRVAEMVFSTERATVNWISDSKFGIRMNVTYISTNTSTNGAGLTINSSVIFHIPNFTSRNDSSYRCAVYDGNKSLVSSNWQQMTRQIICPEPIRLVLPNAELRFVARFDCAVATPGALETFQLLHCVRESAYCKTVYNVTRKSGQLGSLSFTDNQVNSTYFSRFSIAAGYKEETTGLQTIVVYLENVVVTDDASLFRCAVTLMQGVQRLTLESKSSRLSVFAPVMNPVTITWNEPVVEGEPTRVYCTANVGYPRGRINLVVGLPSQRNVVTIDDSRIDVQYDLVNDGTYFAKFIFVVIFTRSLTSITMRCDAVNSLPAAESQGGTDDNPLSSTVSSPARFVIVQHPPSSLYFLLVSSAAVVVRLEPTSFACPADGTTELTVQLEPSDFLQCTSDASPAQRTRWTRNIDPVSSSQSSVLTMSADGSTLVAPDYYSGVNISDKFLCTITWNSLTQSVSLCAFVQLHLIAARNSTQSPIGIGFDGNTNTNTLKEGTSSYNILRIVLAVSGTLVGVMLVNIALFSIRALRRRRARLAQEMPMYFTLQHTGSDTPLTYASVNASLRDLDAMPAIAGDTDNDDRPPAYDCNHDIYRPPTYHEVVESEQPLDEPPTYNESVAYTCA